jgi:hypothetical protein
LKAFLKPEKGMWFSLKSASIRDCELHGAKDSILLSNWCPRIPSPDKELLFWCILEKVKFSYWRQDEGGVRVLEGSPGLTGSLGI